MPPKTPVRSARRTLALCSPMQWSVFLGRRPRMECGAGHASGGARGRCWLRARRVLWLRRGGACWCWESRVTVVVACSKGQL